MAMPVTVSCGVPRRVSARTGWPRAINARAMADPRKPVAPVNRVGRSSEESGMRNQSLPQRGVTGQGPTRPGAPAEQP